MRLVKPSPLFLSCCFGNVENIHRAGEQCQSALVPRPAALQRFARSWRHAPSSDRVQPSEMVRRRRDGWVADWMGQWPDGRGA